MNTVHENAAPANGLWGVLKQIVTINGFFGAGFFKDFSEGWKEAVATQSAPQNLANDDEYSEVDEIKRTHTGDFFDPMDPWGDVMNPWTEEYY